MSLDSPHFPYLAGTGPYTLDFYLARECPKCLEGYHSGPHRTAVQAHNGLPIMLPAALEAKNPDVHCPRCDHPMYLPPTALDSEED